MALFWNPTDDQLLDLLRQVANGTEISFLTAWTSDDGKRYENGPLFRFKNVRFAVATDGQYPEGKGVVVGLDHWFDPLSAEFVIGRLRTDFFNNRNREP